MRNRYAVTLEEAERRTRLLHASYTCVISSKMENTHEVFAFREGPEEGVLRGIKIMALAEGGWEEVKFPPDWFLKSSFRDRSIGDGFTEDEIALAEEIMQSS